MYFKIISRTLSFYYYRNTITILYYTGITERNIHAYINNNVKDII